MSQRQKFRLRLLGCQSEREPTLRGLPTSPVRSSVEQEVRRPELKPDPPQTRERLSRREKAREHLDELLLFERLSK
jgi:hypothetical protein